jgi:hypothetical protein
MHRVVATAAGRQTVELRGRFASSNVMIEDFVDYDTLFPHADVFVTNGGFGSVLAAMRHGVPVVGAGKTEGKNDIDARIGYNRLGVDLGSERPRRHASARRCDVSSPTQGSPPTSLPCGQSSSRTTQWPASRPRSTTRCSPRSPNFPHLAWKADPRHQADESGLQRPAANDMYPVTLVIMGWPWDPCLIAAPSVPWLAFQVGIRIGRPSHNVAEILSPDSLYPTPPTAALVTAWFYISARNGVWVEPRSRTEGRIAVILVIRSPDQFRYERLRADRVRG